MRTHIHTMTLSFKTNNQRTYKQKAWRHTLCKQTRSIKFSSCFFKCGDLKWYRAHVRECAIWEINTQHDAFVMAQYTCVSPIYFNMQAMLEIYCPVMCATVLVSDGRLLHIVWDVILVHSMFFPSVMVQLRWIDWGGVAFIFLSWVCLPLRFILVMLIIDCLHVCLKLFHTMQPKDRELK